VVEQSLDLSVGEVVLTGLDASTFPHATEQRLTIYLAFADGVFQPS
jgi:hypothetical protein